MQLCKNKLGAIQDAKSPTDVKSIRYLFSICYFFRTHFKDFAIKTAPLYTLTPRTLVEKEEPCQKRPWTPLFFYKNN